MRDNGVGMEVSLARALLDAGDGSAPGGGIGLSNVQARLRGTFGTAYGLRLQSEPGRGTTVVMTLPKRPAMAELAVARPEVTV